MFVVKWQITKISKEEREGMDNTKLPIVIKKRNSRNCTISA
jgi:hypothetical protein